MQYSTYDIIYRLSKMELTAAIWRFFFDTRAIFHEIAKTKKNDNTCQIVAGTTTTK